MNYSSFPFCQIGDFRVTALSDGNIVANLDLLSGITPVEAEATQHDAGITDVGNMHINSYLISGRGKNILVDAGMGTLNNASSGLTTNLRLLGINPEDVDAILLTHCHPDHIGGLLDAGGHRVYKNAEIYIHPIEVRYWQDEDSFKQANQRQQRNFLLARRTLNAYASNLRFLGEEDIWEGISPIWLPGHTGFNIYSGDKCLLIWGDIVHYPHIQTQFPTVSIIFDCDPLLAEVTRRKILEQVVNENIFVAGMHLSQQGFAHILADVNHGYHLVYAKS